MLKLIFLLFLFIADISAFDKIYFLPKDNKIAKKEIVNYLKNAKKSIDIAIYNFSYKKFNKALDSAIENGVKVTLIYTKSKLNFNKNIDLIKTKRKQHIKLAIIDDKIAIYGSANWKKESFSKNYEMVNITNDSYRIDKFKKIIKQLKRTN